MNSECIRIADQLNRAFRGDPWHGPPLRDLLAGVTAAQACRRPLPSVHSIWELVVHIGVYVNAALDATHGTPLPPWYSTGRDWPDIRDTTDAAWAAALEALFDGAERFAQAIAQFSDARLQDAAPGREYDFYFLFHGVVQHSLYHGGQIAMLRKAV